MVKVVVAIPVMDEAERIAACLTAVNAQSRRPDAAVLLLNNCTDATEPIVYAMASQLGFQLDVVIRALPPAQSGAGYARCLAMELAAIQTDYDGVLLTTDADAIVPPDWILQNLRALRNGADVVCGQAVIDPVEATLIPEPLHADNAREGRLIALLDHLAWVLDPETHDPWPRHSQASGASLAVWTGAFRRVGGVPAIRSGEDRAFVRALWMIDARVRHDPTIEVTVSGRIVGRAEGGMADAIRRRIVQQDEYTDCQAEPAGDAFRRFSLRCRTRRAWVGSADDTLAGDLRLPSKQLTDCLWQHCFGEAWAAVETASPILQRRRVRFIDLPSEIAAAEALLRQAAMPDIVAAG